MKMDTNYIILNFFYYLYILNSHSELFSQSLDVFVISLSAKTKSTFLCMYLQNNFFIRKMTF